MDVQRNDDCRRNARYQCLLFPAFELNDTLKKNRTLTRRTDSRGNTPTAKKKQQWIRFNISNSFCLIFSLECTHIAIHCSPHKWVSIVCTLHTHSQEKFFHHSWFPLGLSFAMHRIFWFCFVCNSTIIFLPFDCTTRMLFVRIEFDSLCLEHSVFRLVSFSIWFFLRGDDECICTQMFDVCSVHRVGRFNVILKLCFVWFFSDQRHSSTHIYWILFENICRRALKFMRKQNDFSVSDFLRFFVLFIWLYVHCRLRQSWLQQYFSLKIRKKRWIGFSLEIPTVYQIKMQKPKED